MTLREWLDSMPGSNLEAEGRLMLIAKALDAYRSQLSTALDATTATGGDESTEYLYFIWEVAGGMSDDIRELLQKGL
jgi:hypothetical protein